MQLSLPFQSNSENNLFSEENFLTLPENSAASNFFKKFFVQKDFATSESQSLILKGEEASGKTHLLQIFARKFGAEFLDHEKISGVNPADFFARNHFYILENVPEIKEEELLLRLINSAVEAGAFLILSSRITPQFKLKDLASRCKNIFTIEIKNPSHESVKMLLTHEFSRRQIKLSRQVIDLISNNVERSFAAVFATVKLVENLAQNGDVKLSEVKKLFGLV